MAYTSAATKAKAKAVKNSDTYSRSASFIPTAKSRAGKVYVSSKPGGSANVKPISRFRFPDDTSYRQDK